MAHHKAGLTLNQMCYWGNGCWTARWLAILGLYSPRCQGVCKILTSTVRLYYCTNDHSRLCDLVSMEVFALNLICFICSWEMTVFCLYENWLLHLFGGFWLLKPNYSNYSDICLAEFPLREINRDSLRSSVNEKCCRNEWVKFTYHWNIVAWNVAFKTLELKGQLVLIML